MIKDENLRATLMLKNILGTAMLNKDIDVNYEIKKRQTMEIQDFDEDEEMDSQEQIANLGFLKLL